MINIGVFINTYLRPSESFIYHQIIAIKKFHVEVFCRDTENMDIYPWQAINTIGGARKIRALFGRILFTLFRYMPSLQLSAKSKSIKIMHAHFGIDGVYAAALCKKLCIPLIVTFHGYDISRLPRFTLLPLSWLNYWIYFKSLQRNGSLFIAVSSYVHKQLIDKGFPSDRVITHYLGIETDVNCNVERNSSYILFAGRLVEKKGVEHLIDAVGIVRSRFLNVKLMICGDGPQKCMLEKRVWSNHLSENIEFLGWQSKDKVYEYMSNASIFVVPSVTAHNGDCEGLPTVLLEAMARGVPVIGTRHSGIPDAIQDGVNGFLVPERDAAQLADRIIRLLSDPALSKHFARNARQAVEEKFNIRKQVAKLEMIYVNMLK